ncbi:MAG: malate synthase G, partial [Pseudomonadota bacterium]|nr:malate synthase G [Pseudomonadota bacterium]
MSDRIQIGQLQIHFVLHDLIAKEIAPGTGVDPQQFWVDLENILTEFMPRNKTLLAFRDELQEQIDAWHLERSGQPIDEAEYTAFLRDIGYILDEGDDFEIETDNVDEEIALMAGPQLVVPV